MEGLPAHTLATRDPPSLRLLDPSFLMSVEPDSQHVGLPVLLVWGEARRQHDP